MYNKSSIEASLVEIVTRRSVTAAWRSIFPPVFLPSFSALLSFVFADGVPSARSSLRGLQEDQNQQPQLVLQLLGCVVLLLLLLFARSNLRHVRASGKFECTQRPEDFEKQWVGSCIAVELPQIRRVACLCSFPAGCARLSALRSTTNLTTFARLWLGFGRACRALLL
jgi:hypothetical protein